jgi:hypothetical protein
MTRKPLFAARASARRLFPDRAPPMISSLMGV